MQHEETVTLELATRPIPGNVLHVQVIPSGRVTQTPKGWQLSERGVAYRVFRKSDKNTAHTFTIAYGGAYALVRLIEATFNAGAGEYVDIQGADRMLIAEKRDVAVDAQHQGRFVLPA